MDDEPTVSIGVVAPLSQPGWVDAGQHLLAGCEMAACDANAVGGVNGRKLELIVRDTAADPSRAAAAVEELAQAGVVALAGEYHSVAARSVAATADRLGVPYLCSSAVIDELTERPSDWVARLAPAQSHAWSVYADFLVKGGHNAIAVAAQPSVYWDAGIRLLSERLTEAGGEIFRLNGLEPSTVPDELVRCGATALLLLVGIPEPAATIVRAVRRDPRLKDITIGAPAGQPELPTWRTLLGDDSGGVSFLRYRPTHLNPYGARVEELLHRRLGTRPSFVALEGYDTINVLVDLLRRYGTGHPWRWAGVDIEGTRGRIMLSRIPTSGLWQWTWPPVQVADRNPYSLGQFRTLSVDMEEHRRTY